uniref:Uncharacterized protein n=1 Tax=Hippocampus comes TaxID=109280 RepID=A0A3Q2XVT1_HIPCM
SHGRRRSLLPLRCVSGQDPLHILGVQPVDGTSDVDLLVAVERPEKPGGGGRMGGFYTPQEVAAKLREARGQLRGVLAGAVAVGGVCSGELECGDKVCEQMLAMEAGSLLTYTTERVSLVSLPFRRIETCTCPRGACPAPVELCEGQSCPADMQCVRSGPTAPSVCQCLPERLEECAGRSSLSFSGNSYIKYKVTESGQSGQSSQGGEMKLGLSVRTLQTSGVIMFTRVNPCTMLKIEGGRLWFQLDCDNTLGIMGISGRQINDGLWHAVALELTSNYTLLSLDDSYVERRRAARAPVRLWPVAPESSFFFGAQVRPPAAGGQGARAQDGFQGCLGRLTLNGRELPLLNKRSRYAEIAGLSEVEPGCVLYPDPCVSAPCLNGAMCASLPLGGFGCTCISGFTGGRCESPVTPCTPNPCQAGGECQAMEGGASGFVCECPPGLIGLTCDEDVDECEHADCGNGGECVNTPGSFYCNCTMGDEDGTCGGAGDGYPLSYVGPGEIIGIGVLAFVIILLLILFVIFRKKIQFRKDSAGAAGVIGRVDCGDVGGGLTGPPQVVVRPNAHSPFSFRAATAGRPPILPSQLSKFLSETSNVRSNRRGVAVCSVAPTNLPPPSPCRRLSRHSPAHKVSWDGGASHAPAEVRRRDEREDEWSLRAFEMERTDASEAYHWDSSRQSSGWFSPSRLRPPEVGSHYDLSDAQQNIRRGGSTRSLQLDYPIQVPSGDRGRESLSEARRRAFQWEKNQSGEWQRTRWPGGQGRQQSSEESPVYEEYREPRRDSDPSEETEALYDTLPPTREAYDGYPSSPPGLSLHPAQLLPPLRAWASGSREGGGGNLGSAAITGSGDELERLLNLVSLRARRATRTNRTSTGSEPAAGGGGFK